MALARNKSASAPAANNCPFGHGGTGIDPWRIDWRSSEDIRLQLRDSVGTNYNSSVTDGMGNSAGIYNAQNWNLMGGTFNGTTMHARINYIKDETGTSFTDVLGSDTDSGNRPHIGNASSGGTNSWNGWVSMVAVWNRALSDAEWNSMVINPWQPLKSRSVLILLAIATVSGQTLTITLVDSSGTPLSNLTGLNWAWFNESVTSSANAPSDTGTGATTDSSGILQLTLPNTTLTAGQTGMLALMDSSGMIYAWYRVTL